MKMWKALCGLLLLAGLTLPAAQAAEKPSQLTFGVIPVASSRNVSESFDGLVKHLEKELGIKVVLQPAGDYTAVITGMEHGHIDIAYLGPKSYVEAAERAGAEAIAVELSENGVAGYHGLIITKAGSGLNTLESLKGKTWAFTDPQSTSGTLVPKIYFHEIKIDPDTYFGKVIYSGSHEASILAVKSGKVDGASTNDLDFERGLGKGWNKEDFNFIWKSELIPASPIAVSKKMDPALKDALKKALISYKDKEGLSLLKISGYAEGKDEMFDSIRKQIALKKQLEAKK